MTSNMFGQKDLTWAASFCTVILHPDEERESLHFVVE